jgi:hypothetical protein
MRRVAPSGVVEDLDVIEHPRFAARGGRDGKGSTPRRFVRDAPGTSRGDGPDTRSLAGHGGRRCRAGGLVAAVERRASMDSEQPVLRRVLRNQAGARLLAHRVLLSHCGVRRRAGPGRPEVVGADADGFPATRSGTRTGCSAPRSLRSPPPRPSRRRARLAPQSLRDAAGGEGRFRFDRGEVLG